MTDKKPAPTEKKEEVAMPQEEDLFEEFALDDGVLPFACVRHVLTTLQFFLFHVKWQTGGRRGSWRGRGGRGAAGKEGGRAASLDSGLV